MYRIEDNIYAKETGDYGKSLYAKRDFKKDELVFVAFGPLVSEATDYTIPIDHTLKIEPREPEGNLCQYICHSCEPNVGIKSRTCFVAMRDIKQDEEAVTHYGFLGYDFGDELPIEKRACKCCSASCKGIMRGYKDLTTQEREQWKEYISDYLLDPRYK
jgi:hypothetical protein